MLIDSVTKIKGIGEETAKALNDMGIHTIVDLIEYFPYRYEDYRLKDLKDVKHQERVTVVGKVQSEATLRYFAKKKSRVAVRVLIDRYLITCVFFNRPYVKKQLQIGETITITGSWDKNKQSINVSEMKKGEIIRSVDFEPVYHVQGDVTVKGMKRFISLALHEFSDFIEDYLPDYFRSKYKLLPRKDAVRHIHFPKSKEHLKHARRRLVYEEFLLFQLKMQALRKFNREQSNGKGLTIDENAVQRFINALPYPLTNAQQRVIKEILTDMTSQYRMNRLLQGDVGSGKTAVAMICSFAAVQAGVQAALMVPTEILAEQHVQSLKETMASFALRVELLTSSIKGKKRKELLEKLASGEIDIIVGTHSLIQDEVSFSNLGLVITDEQHRFGVEQRRVLREKGEHPDVLFMTATPIPRTLAITAFGDMDVSVINEMPAGRKPVETYWAKK
jgi:ATP-dependent DNA helicase RecG